MYEPIEGGSTYKVSFPINDVEEVEYEVHLPPVGYVHNRLTDIIERREILFKDNPKEKQKWKRVVLPDDWNKRRKLEAKKRKEDHNYFDKELQEFIDQEWDRRI